MPGKLIWLAGPPAPGKDSLLAALRQREHPQLLVAHRYITRPRLTWAARIISLSEHEFFTRQQHLLPQLARQQYLLWHWRGD